MRSLFLEISYNRKNTWEPYRAQINFEAKIFILIPAASIQANIIPAPVTREDKILRRQKPIQPQSKKSFKPHGWGLRWQRFLPAATSHCATQLAWNKTLWLNKFQLVTELEQKCGMQLTLPMPSPSFVYGVSVRRKGTAVRQAITDVCMLLYDTSCRTFLNLFANFLLLYFTLTA